MEKNGTAASLLRELRRREGQSLRSVASDLGLAPSQLSRMERGERPVGEQTVRRLSDYYQVPTEVIEIAQGHIPADILAILRAHPEEISRLRDTYPS